MTRIDINHRKALVTIRRGNQTWRETYRDTMRKFTVRKRDLEKYRKGC